MNSVNLSERVAVVGYIAPDAYAAGTVLTNAIDMSKQERILAVVQAGDLGTNATLDFKFTGSDTSGGTYADITGAAITQLTQAGTDSNKTVLLELKAESLAGTTVKFVKGSLTIATATSDAGVVVIGGDFKHDPASNNDIGAGTEGAVDEIVVA